VPCYSDDMAKSTGKSRSEVVTESRKRGAAATGAAVATGVATATIGFVPLTVVGVGATGMLAYRWWKHRSENGIKF